VEELGAMPHHEIYERLKQVARNGGIVPYSEIAPMAGLDISNPADRNQLSEILFDISMAEYEKGQPLLSAVVTFKDIPYPGRGFFDMARQFRLYNGRSEMDELEFFTKEVKRVHEYWKNH